MNYIVRVTDSGPLSFREGREPAGGTTLDYIPGSVLLGGLAATHTQTRNNESEFNQFFLSESASFGNLYPSSFSKADLMGDIDPVYPLPTTAYSCKRFTGFRFDEDDPKDMPHHGVYDSLTYQTLFALSGQTNSDILAELEACPECGEALDRFDGYYRRNPFEPAAIGTAEAEQGLRTRTGISRATGTVQQGILYSREVLRSGTTFWGTVTIPGDHSDSFYEFVEEVNTKRLLRLGNNRTRGFGRVNLELEEIEEEDSTAELRTRIEAFNTKLSQAASLFNISLAEKIYLPLTLIADTIIMDRLLRYQSAISSDYLATRGLNGIKLIHQNSSLRRVVGWNDALRIPKPDEIAITKGSVFVYELQTSFDDKFLKSLLEIQNLGLGSRCREGFGRLLVANPFHWEVNGQ